MTPRVLIYVQHLLGVGHVKRAAALCRALCVRGADVTVAMGGFRVPLADFGTARVVQLPPVRAADMSFKSLIDDQGDEVTEDWWARRRDALIQLGREASPHVVLIEHYPFGRRAFGAEIEPLLDSLSAQTAIICSVRDVLVARNNPKKNNRIADLVLRRFDHVLVHGDENVIPFQATFPPAGRFSDRLIYTGYITEGEKESPEVSTVSDVAERTQQDGALDIVVSTGGGAVGESLLEAAVAAAREPGLRQARWRLLAGDNLDQDIFNRLKGGAPEHVLVERARSDFQALLRGADLSISQGGYNTVMDVIAARCRNIIIPFADGGESEQAYRAERFEKMGLLNLLPGDDLSGKKLADRAAHILARPAPSGASQLKLDGAARSAEFIVQLASERT